MYKNMTLGQAFKRIPKYMYSHLDHFFVYHISKISPKVATEFHYRKVMGRRLNLSNPQELNEKLQWLKLNSYYNNPLIKQCADKYAVREYVERKGCEKILNELYGVWNSPDEIVWEKLPNQFVLKCNHGSGYNLVCKDKSKLDTIETKKLLENGFMKTMG